MSSKMSAKEFTDWMIYDSYEPLLKTEVQLATLSSVVLAAAGIKSSASEFMVSKSVEQKREELNPSQPKLTGKALNDYLKGAF